MILAIVHDVCKTIMFITIWALPFLLAYSFENPIYLWFFVVSFFVSVSIFSHYEDLTKIEKGGSDGE